MLGNINLSQVPLEVEVEDPSTINIYTDKEKIEGKKKILKNAK